MPEFIIKVTHPDPIHASKVYFHLHIKSDNPGAHIYFRSNKCLVRLPKTYPTLATPVFTIQKPRGINHDHEITLQKAIHSEAQMLRGSEMVFQVRIYPQSKLCSCHLCCDQIITSAQEWLADHVHPAIESSGSLATEMTKRALEEEKVLSPLLSYRNVLKSGSGTKATRGGRG